MKLILLLLLFAVSTSAGAVDFVIPEVQAKFDAIDSSVSAIETLANGKILMGNGSNVGTEVTPSGDVTMTNAGVNAIAAGVVINADVKSDAAIDYSKLATLTDGNILVGSAGNVAASVNPSGDIDVTNAGLFSIAAGVVTEADLVAATTDSLGAHRLYRETYDFAVEGGAISTIALGTSLPDNAIVRYCYYDVLTTLTSSTDAATMAINIPTDGDLQAAIAISDGTNPYDAGLIECDTKGTDMSDPSTFIKTTAARDVSVVIAVEAVTAGKFVLYLVYDVSD
jgi:hypothetical protein